MLIFVNIICIHYFFVLIVLGSLKISQQEFANSINNFLIMSSNLLLNDYCDFLMRTLYGFIHITTAFKLIHLLFTYGS